MFYAQNISKYVLRTEHFTIQQMVTKRNSSYLLHINVAHVYATWYWSLDIYEYTHRIYVDKADILYTKMDQTLPNRWYICIQWTLVLYSVVITWQSNPPISQINTVMNSRVSGQCSYTKLKLKLKIFIGISAKLIANGHVQIYKYTEYGQWPNKCFEHNCKI